MIDGQPDGVLDDVIAARAVAADVASACAVTADGAGDFLDAFESLTLAIRRARGATQDTDDALSISQYTLIRALAGRETARVSELAGDAEITPSTATRILDVLERRMMVRRTRTQPDRRGVTVSLTEAGRAALTRQDAWMRGRQREFYESLPSGEREHAARLLVRLVGLIDELAAGPQD